MNISLNWLKEFITQEIPLEELTDKLTMSGLEVEDVQQICSVKGGLEGLVIGQVIAHQKHPNADKLSLCKVDIGNAELLSIVCGAPNVAKDQKVIVAPVGATIYPTNGEPFEIKSAKIRGEASQGMICAEDEIGLGMDHEGILVLEDSAVIGKPAKEYFSIYKDTVLEIGLTANRGDAASHLGVARDVAALFNVPVQLPEGMDIHVNKNELIIVQLTAQKECPRYSGLLIKNIKVAESPDWIKNKLKAIGLNPVNNIVDISNYVMHEIGQPIHCFDAKKIAENKVIIRMAKPGETITTLDKEKRKLTGNELLIADSVKPLAIAGVMGGLDSAVTNTTTEIFIESAFFHAGTIRKAAKSHAINSDASFRFERGTDPEITIYALERMAKLILETAGGEIASKPTDVYPEKISPVKLRLKLSEIENVSGFTIPEKQISNILNSLGFKILSQQTDYYDLEVPLFKSDVTRPIDVIEEIIRIYGLDNIPLKTHFSIHHPASSAEDKIHQLKFKVSEYLRANGFSEMMNNSLTKEKYQDKETSVGLLNPLSSDLGVMRDNLLNGALESIAYNQNRKAESIKLFEFGNKYSSNEGKITETPTLCIVAAGNRFPETWEQSSSKIDYFYIKQILSGLFQTGGLDLDTYTGSFTYGEIEQKKLHSFDIKLPVSFAEIDWKKWCSKSLKQKFELKEIPKYQSVRRDLSLILKEEITFEQIKDLSMKTERKHLEQMNVFDVYRGKNLEVGTKSYAISFHLSDNQKTMNDKQIDQIMQKISNALNQEFGAVLRS